MGAPKASFVKRARMSAGAGPHLFGAGVVLGAIGLFLGPLYVPIIIVMALAAPLLQLPRQKAWLTQNDMLEFASLGAMPVLLAVLAFVWLAPAGLLSLSNILQGLSGFFVALGIFHVLTKAHTLRIGTVRRRFDVEINGDWDGETLTLVEDFVYEDKSTEQRVWTLQKTGPDSWRGTAPGVIGEALGEENGDTFNWRYLIDLPVPDGILRVQFDDWMWKLSDTRVPNRAYMKKYGVDIGEVIITFEKQP